MRRNLNPGWAIGTFAVCLALGGCLASEAPKDGPKPAPVVRCEEDEPCWDCHTMGNLICGPTTTTDWAELIPPATLEAK